MAAVALLAGMACLPLAAHAQSSAVLDRLLFDPRPADATPVQSPAVLSTVSPAADAGSDASAIDADNIQQYLELIAAEELDNGPFAPALMEHLLALGEAYQQEGDHEAALAAFERADYVIRINSGLYAPQQFAIVENMIASHLARGELQEANTQQQRLLFLSRQNFGDDSLEVVPALETLGNWNLDAFRALLNQSNASNFTLNSAAGIQINGANPKVLAFGNLYQAQSNYYRAVQNLISHQQYSDPKLLDLERKLAETSFLAAHRESIMEDPDDYLRQRGTYTGTHIARMRRGSLNFLNGRNAYQRMRIYQETTPGTDPVAVAGTIIALGDWHLLFKRQGQALKIYREAQRYLTEHAVPEAAIAALLTPAVPQQLPAFTPLPHSREKFGISPDAALPYDGYVDLRFRLSRFGNVGHIEVLDQTGPFTADMERRLLRLLRGSPFRPRFIAGEPATSDQVNVRYYFAQID